jgi:hypothetical protein
MNKKWLVAMGVLLALPALACITIEFGPAEETPEATVVAFRTPPYPFHAAAADGDAHTAFSSHAHDATAIGADPARVSSAILGDIQR